MGRVKATVDYLRACIAYRDAGGSVSYVTDPVWLIQMAINRRAGWPDDPSTSRGSAKPVDGKYPRKAEGDLFSWARRVASQVNTPRLIVRPSEVPFHLRARLQHRLWTEGSW